MARLVLMESPYRPLSNDPAVARIELERNVLYARMAMRDSLLRGESPMASHLLYTQPHVLDDASSPERSRGIEAGLAWAGVATMVVVYTDLGISEGMQAGISRAGELGLTVEYRTLEAWQATRKYLTAA